jgi:hypothetical protein
LQINLGGKMKKLIIVCIVMIGMVGLLNAFPFANYGNVRVPDAYVMPHTMAKISLINYMGPENNQQDDDYEYVWGAALNIGLLNYAELGIVASGDEVYYGHFKLRVVRETIALPDIAIGIDNLFSKVPSKNPSSDYPDMASAGQYRRNSLYVAISKTALLSGIPAIGDLPTRVTLGAGSHRFQGTVKMSEQFGGLFGAFQIEPVSNVTFIAEIDGHNLNSGLEFRVSNFAIKGILYRIEEWSKRDAKFGLNLSYAFDRYVSEQDRQFISPMAGHDRQLIDTREGASLDELQRIRRQRERAESELEEIRRLLED